MRLSVMHSTRYDYSEPVPFGISWARMTPKNSLCQNVLDWQLVVEGGTVEASYDDYNNNRVDMLRFDADATSVGITAEGIVDTRDTAGILGVHKGTRPLTRFFRQSDLTCPGKGIASILNEIGGSAEGELECLHYLSRVVFERVKYKRGTTCAETTVEEAISKGTGVCQDQAHVFISAARGLGVPSRYVGGYLFMDGQSEQSAGHAWAEAYITGLGWTGFDISNQVSPDERYVRVSTGSDYREAAPLLGIYRGPATEVMSIVVRVEA